MCIKQGIPKWYTLLQTNIQMYYYCSLAFRFWSSTSRNSSFLRRVPASSPEERGDVAASPIKAIYNPYSGYTHSRSKKKYKSKFTTRAVQNAGSLRASGDPAKKELFLSLLLSCLLLWWRSPSHYCQRSSICEGREFIDCPARYKCPIENILLKLRTKAEHWTSSPNRCWCLHIAHVTMSSPAFANTFVVRLFLVKLINIIYPHHVCKVYV